MDMATFMANGAIVFGDQEYGAKRDRIEQMDLGCTLLIHGFDHLANPHLIVVDNPGVAQFVAIDYWAIGSGSYMALSRLSLHRQSAMLSLEETIYNVVEAKVAAERALGVGQHTYTFILEKGKPQRSLKPETGGILMREAGKRIVLDPPRELLDLIKADLETTPTPAENQTAAKRSTPKSPTRDRKAPKPSQA